MMLVASVRKGLLSNLGNVEGFVNENGISNLDIAFGLLGRVHLILLAVRIVIMFPAHISKEPGL